MVEGKGGPGYISLSFSRERDIESLAPVERFFEQYVVPLVTHVAGEGLGGAIPIASDQFGIEELKEFLATRAKDIFVLSGAELQKKGRAARKVKGVLVYIGEEYDVDPRLVVTTAEAISSVDDQYPVSSSVYLFEPDPSEKSVNDRRTAWQIRAQVRSEHGLDSEEYADVDRIIGVLRLVLFGSLRNDEVMDLMPELTRLRVKLGRTAMAIIADFIQKFQERVDEEIEKGARPEGTSVSPQDVTGKIVRAESLVRRLERFL